MINNWLDKNIIIIKKIIKYILFFCFSIFCGTIASSWTEIFLLKNQSQIANYLPQLSALIGLVFGLTVSKKMWRKTYPFACNLCHFEFDKYMDFDCGYGHIYKASSCPSCGSHPRHRTAAMYLKKVLPKNKIINVLHFAPEASMNKFFNSYKKIDYLSVDIEKDKAMKQEDITNLSFKNETFDFIYCSCVLEHVIDDKKAMSELYRVLKANGFALIDVPIDYQQEKTLESPDIKTKEERTEKYWQWDHVRLYGLDFPDKLKEVGFKIDILEFTQSLTPEKQRMFGLEKVPIYVCKK